MRPGGMGFAMSRTVRLLSVLALGCTMGSALAERTAQDPQSLPCNALCRRWMGLGEAAEPAPAPAREALAMPEPVAAPPAAPPAPPRPESRSAGARPSPALGAAPPPPARLHRDPRTAEARRKPLPASSAAHAPKAVTGPRGPVAPAAAVVVAGMQPIAPPPRPAPQPSAAAPVPIPVPLAETAHPAARIEVVLPPPDLPLPPVIALPITPGRDALPPAFDVIAALLLAAPPRR